MLTDFHNCFDDRITGKFARRSSLNIPPHLKYVVTLPCEIRKLEKWRKSEICIVVNDKSHVSVVMSYFITNLPLNFFFKRIFLNRWMFGEVTSKMVGCVICPVRLRLLFSKMQNSPDKQDNLCVMDRNWYWLSFC